MDNNLNVFREKDVGLILMQHLLSIYIFVSIKKYFGLHLMYDVRYRNMLCLKSRIKKKIIKNFELIYSKKNKT